jgi:putative acetyltransferase
MVSLFLGLPPSTTVGFMHQHQSIDIIDYEDRFAADFVRLNTAWLEQFNLLELADLELLHAPREMILAAGGCILIAVAAGEAVGTCALLQASPGVMELAKLAVAPAMQGQGLGRRLTVAALERARQFGAKRVVLVSNHQLVAAIRLYESLGFQHMPLPADTGYATADVCMELILGNS